MANISGELPFDIACRQEASLEVLRVLVERTPATVKMTDEGEELLPSPFLFTCSHWAGLHSLQNLRWLLGIDPSAVETANADGNLPLHLVCMAQAPLAAVQILVERHPAAVETANNDGHLPLHLACNSQASLKVLQFLVEMDPASVETANNVGNWPVHLACCNHAGLDVVQILVERTPPLLKRRTMTETCPCTLHATARHH
jgi:ankyrin repeat protein